MLTHPSEHNAIIIVRDKKTMLEKKKNQKKEAKDRMEDLEEAASKGNPKDWAGFILSRTNNMAHHISFMIPLDESAL